jgi:probable HAF family extracellular repeat protein
MSHTAVVFGKVAAAAVAVAVVAVGSASVGAGTSSSAAGPAWIARDLGGKGTRAEAVDIDEQGRVAGSIATAGSGRQAMQAFVWAGGKLRRLGTLPLGGGADMPNVSEAIAINDRGQIVGTSYVDQNDPVFKPFLWSAGRMTELPCPGAARMGGATAINGRGQVVGWCGDARPGEGKTHAVLWVNAKPRLLGALGGSSVAVALNDRGQVVGASGRRAFLWQDGRITDLGALRGAGTTVATAINERGQVAGTSGRHAFIWQSGRLTDLGALGRDRFSEAVAINDRGQVVGLSFPSFDARVAGAHRAFVWHGGVLRDVGTLGGRSSSAAAINERGQVVGQSTTRSGAYRGFVWENGRMLDLAAIPSASVSYAVAINDRGQAVGVSMMRDGTRHAVLWTRR